MFSLGNICWFGTRCHPFHIVLATALALAILSAHAGPGPEPGTHQPEFSVMVLPAITGDDDQAQGPQIAVRWSGELPVQLQPGTEDAAGRWQARGEPFELNEPMSLLPAPDQVGDMLFRVQNAAGAVLASARGEAETFGWTPTFAGPNTGMSGPVHALTVHNGDLIAGGGFTQAGGETVNNIARWDGSQWSALSGPNGTGMNGGVYALTVHNGDLIAGGLFAEAGGETVNNIARWDGSQWSALSGPNGTGMTARVGALTEHDGDLIAGGWFNRAGGKAANYIARWDGSQWLALSGPNGTGMNNLVSALTVHNGDLIAGGNFTRAGGLTVNHIARWDGSQWSALSDPNGAGMNNGVVALTVHNGDLIAGGWFTEAGGETVNRIARWEGSQWSALSGPNGTGMDYQVSALTVHNGDLIAGGLFTDAGGETVNRIARWDDSQWSALSGPNGTGMNNWGLALTVHNGDLIAGGNFTQAGGLPASRLAHWKRQIPLTTLNPDSGPSAGGTTVTISGSDFQAGATVNFAGNACINVDVPSSTEISCDTPPGTAGTVDVTVENPDGYSGTLIDAFTYVDAPSLGTINPDSGPSMGGTAVTLTGTAFQAGATVSFGVAECTNVDVPSSTEISCDTPPGTAGTADVIVENPDGQIVTLSDGFTYFDPPSISEINPGSGPAVGGTTVTLSGSDFQSGATVSFAGSACTNISVLSSTEINCDTPPGTAGTADVTVENPDGQSATFFDGYTYVDAPSLSAVHPASGPSAGGTTVTFIGTAFQAGATVSFAGNVCTNISVVSSTEISCNTPPGTAGTVDVIVENPDGQSATLIDAYTYIDAPAINTINPDSGPSAGGTTVTLIGTAFQAGATVSFAGNACTNIDVLSSTEISCDTPPGTAGTADVTVENPDGQSATFIDAYTYIDGPAINAINPDSGPSAGGTTVTLIGTAFQTGATVSFGGTACTNIDVLSSTEISCDTPPGTAGTVDVTVENPDGQSATLIDAYTYVDGPAINTINPDSGPSAGGTTVTLSGSDFQAGAVVSFAGNACTNINVLSSTEISCDTPPGTAGTADVTVENPDGQIATLIDDFTYFDPPAISEINPDSGPAVGGTTVTLIGSAFQNGATVSFGGTACTNIDVLSGTEISCDTPPGTAGAVDVVIENPDSQVAILSDGFTYIDAPTLSAINPASGPGTGGTTVTLSGTAFQTGATVSLGGNECTSVDVVSNTEISCDTPPGTAGTVGVTVENPDGQSATLIDAYTYVDGPAINTINPDSGPSAGGTTVTLSGSDFQAGAVVSFAGNACTNIDVLSDTEISCDTPPGTAGTVDVIVENPDGQIATLIDGFTYVDGPAITEINPDTGPAEGGTTVTLSGSDFQTGATVSFAGNACINVDVPSSTEISCDTPPGTAGAVDVTVENPDSQIATLTGGFSYVDAPSLSAVNPASGTVEGGTGVTLIGTAFQAGATVSFGGSECTNINVLSSTEISCNTPPGAIGAVDIIITNPDGQSDTLAAGFAFVPAPIAVPMWGLYGMLLLIFSMFLLAGHRHRRMSE